MKISHLIFISLVVAGFISVYGFGPAQAQSPRFEMAPNIWRKDAVSGHAVRRGYNNLAPLAIQNVPSGKTVSAQNLTGINFATLPKHRAVATGQLVPASPVVQNPSVFGKPNAPAAAHATAMRPGLPMTASPILATMPAKQFPTNSTAKPGQSQRSINGKRIEKMPVALNYPRGAGFVSGPTSPALYTLNKQATTNVGGKILPRH